MSLSQTQIVIPCADLYNEFELWYPYYRLLEAGATVVLAGPKAKTTYASKIGLPVTSDLAFADLDPAAFAGVVIPGGYAPDHMRRSPELLAFVRELFAAGKLVAHI